MAVGPFVLLRNLVPRGNAFLKIVVLGVIAFFSIHLLFGSSLSDTDSIRDGAYSALPSLTTSQSSGEKPPCAKIRGAEDVLVVIKTGATELDAKLPPHLRTTTSCYPDFLLFSDFEEWIDGHHVYDVLDEVSDDIRQHHSDFEIYRRLRNQGKKALKEDELSGPLSSSGGVSGKPQNPGWRLDKWKFLPMMNKTLTMYPDKKWYVFSETDTYIVWHNLMEWLNLLNPEIDIYAGFQMQIGEQIFAHGGSGFVVSNAALRIVTDYHAKNVSWWESYTDLHWAGDCVLGKAFQEAGSPLLWSWPLIQGDKPSTLDFFAEHFDARLWCAPAVTYHHLAADEVAPMWKIEQDWIEKHDTPMKQSDLFKEHMLPQMSHERENWDNMPGDSGQGLPRKSLHECRELCQTLENCLQYQLYDGRCTTSSIIKLGEATTADVRSGWMKDRIEQFVREAHPCDSEDWITRRVREAPKV